MRLIVIALAIMVTFTMFGRNHADSVDVRFRAGRSTFDPSMGDNRMVMDKFISEVRKAVAAGDLERIEVRGYASPDGGEKSNERLAHNRCVTIANYIVKNANVERKYIEELPQGVAWGELRRLVEETPDVPAREKVLQILDKTPLYIFGKDGRIISGRKKQLMDLKGGRPYNWMLANLFPQLRNVVAVSLYLKDPETPEVSPEDKAREEIIEVLPVEPTETEELIETEIVEVSEEKPVIEYDYHPHHFALKTNLLYDAALLPNLEFEWLINKNWSVSIEGDVAWWKFNFKKIYRLAMISPEVKYYINPRSPFHGMYAGLFGGIGKYQLEFSKEGYRGEGWMGGVSFGYMWPIGKHLSLDAGIGAGFMSTRYKVYESHEDHKVYMRTKSLTYFGPLKLKLSLAWRFDINTKTIKVNSIL